MTAYNSFGKFAMLPPIWSGPSHALPLTSSPTHIHAEIHSTLSHWPRAKLLYRRGNPLMISSSPSRQSSSDARHTPGLHFHRVQPPQASRPSAILCTLSASQGGLGIDIEWERKQYDYTGAQTTRTSTRHRKHRIKRSLKAKVSAMRTRASYVGYSL